MRDILNKQVQKTISYKSLFDSPGWLEYENRIKEFASIEQLKIDKLTRKLVTEEDRERLNQHIATLLGLQYLLIVKENMLDETNESSTSPDSDEGA